MKHLSGEAATREAFEGLLREARHLTLADACKVPSKVVQSADSAGRQPVFQLWVQAELSSEKWVEAFRIFTAELGLVDPPQAEDCYWSVETFSNWAARPPRDFSTVEAQNWFSAFDFDKDGKLSLWEFMLGIVAVDGCKSLPTSAASLRSLVSLKVLQRLLVGRAQTDLSSLQDSVAKVHVSTSIKDLSAQALVKRFENQDFVRSCLPCLALPEFAFPIWDAPTSTRGHVRLSDDDVFP